MVHTRCCFLSRISQVAKKLLRGQQLPLNSSVSLCYSHPTVKTHWTPPPPSYYTRTLGGHDCSTPLSCSCNAGCSLHHAARLSAAAAASCQGLARDEPRKHVQCLPGACLWHHVARALDSGITQAAVIVNHVASNLRSTHMTRHTTFDILNDYC